MAEPLFTLSIEPDAAYCRELLADGMMPTAVVCIQDAETERLYSVRGKKRLAGLPIIDLGQRMLSYEGPAVDSVSRRLAVRFKFPIPSEDLRAIPAQSQPSPYIRNLRQHDFPEIHHRIYFPFVGKTSIIPEPTWLTDAPAEQVLRDLRAGHPDPEMAHMIRVQRQIIAAYAIHAPVEAAPDVHEV